MKPRPSYCRSCNQTHQFATQADLDAHRDDIRAAERAHFEDKAEPRNWMVWDATRPDPWGVNQGDFGPMTRTEAEAFVARGAAATVPRRYFAGPIRTKPPVSPTVTTEEPSS